MPSQITSRSYAYAGLEDVFRNGFSVGECATRLRRFCAIENRLMQIQAAHMVSVPQRDFKTLLARFLYENARHTDTLRRRLRELRVPKKSLDAAPDEELLVVLDELLFARNSAELVAGLRWLQNELRAAYNDYLQHTNHLADFPSVEVINAIVAHQNLGIALLDAAHDDLVDEAQKESANAFVAHLQLCLEAAGGIDGTGASSTRCARERSTQAFVIKHELARDELLQRVWDFVAPPQSEVGPHLSHMMSIRLSEINVAEGLAIVLFETRDKPWEFYFAIARHLWDEVRHSLMGEAAIEATLGDRAALPMRDYEGFYCMEATPLEQYATLGLEVEGANMRYPIGKRGEWEFCKDAAQHPLMTTFQDFDWADEVLHVNIAREQLSQWFEGGARALSEFAVQGKAHRTQVKKRHAPVELPVVEDIVQRGRGLNH
ncbi:MAG TPA: hypothetical protein VM821_06935 [Abditibacteriaceae bacterium]|nr:hypothetical protein [Abditibacteriaceae bacterium]